MSTSSKPKIALYWCASCGGCEETVVDLAEDILGVVAAVDIVLWPVAMDFKYKSIEAMPDKSITATLLNGAIRSTEQEEMAHLMRRKSQFLIAYGSCAVSGGIPGMANQFSREQILKFNYEDAPTLGNGGPKTRPQLKFAEAGREVSLPELHNVVRSLDQVVDVDYYVPGCPPTPNLTKAAITALLEGKLPPKGSVLAPDIALCDECSRKKSKPTNLSITEFKRPHQLLADPELCFLAQGVVCMGPATRSGCGSQCTDRQHALHRLLRPHVAGPRPGRSRSCPPSAPMSRRRKKATSTKCWRVSRTPSALSTVTASPRACCGGR